MTPNMLQDELVDELKRLLSDYLYKSPSGGRVPINVFPQDLPVKPVGDEDETEFTPYIIVRLNSGKDDGTRESANTVKLVLIIGIWDDALEHQGHRDILNIIQKIYERFHKNPNLNFKAVYSGGFNWLVQEDDYYPYYFGACTLNFNIAAIRREDPLA